MKKFIAPEIEMKELFTSDSIMEQDLSAIIVSDESTAKTNFVEYDDSATSNDYNMWKGKN